MTFPPLKFSVYVINQSVELFITNLRSDNFDKRRVGLREIAFRADSRTQVDAVAKELEAHGGKLIDAPQEYPQYAPGYYSVFFTDPDGLKLEVVTYSK